MANIVGLDESVGLLKTNWTISTTIKMIVLAMVTAEKKVHLT